MLHSSRSAAQQSPRINKLLAALPEADYQRLAPHLKAVDLPHGDILADVGQSLHHIYFLASGVASVVAESTQGIAVEVGMVGREGFIGASALLGEETVPLRAMMQVPGNGWRIPVDVLREEFRRRGAFQELALRYIQVLLTQSAQNTLCNRLHTVDQRLSRWLLMIRDRVESDQLYITHEFVSDLLGVRRAGVTVALGRFRDAGMIHHTRGYVTLLDEAALEKTTCECYSVIEGSFQRLFK